MLVAGALLATVAPASASELITWGIHDPALIVNKYGVARVSYTDRNGVRHHTLAWGAVNARTPSQEQGQIKFKLDYSGGSGGFTSGYWRRMRNACKPYTGPALADRVIACTAPDGSYWALQSWRRELRDGGWKGTLRQQSAELHLSHWTGKLPQLFADTAWLQNGKIDRVFGYLHYASKGVYGFGSTGVGAPLDGYGRNIYIDTLNPDVGQGLVPLQLRADPPQRRQLLPGHVQDVQAHALRQRLGVPADRDGPRRNADRLVAPQGAGQVLGNGSAAEDAGAEVVHAGQRLVPLLVLATEAPVPGTG